ncbi:hypothetical protein Tco_0711664 [Tanacetum coccineum]
MLVMIDDEHVLGMIGDVSLMNDEHLVIDRTVIEPLMVDEHLVPEKIIDESLVIRLEMVVKFCIYLDWHHSHSYGVYVVD